MRLLDAELVHAREILPGQWLQAYRAPWLAAGAVAGQFVHVRTGDLSGLVRMPAGRAVLALIAAGLLVHAAFQAALVLTGEPYVKEGSWRRAAAAL